MIKWERLEIFFKKIIYQGNISCSLQPDIVEREVNWILGSITMRKASGGDGIPAEVFQILKDDAVKVLHSIGQ